MVTILFWCMNGSAAVSLLQSGDVHMTEAGAITKYNLQRCPVIECIGRQILLLVACTWPVDSDVISIVLSVLLVPCVQWKYIQYM